jgi:hypothetical protein
MKLPESSGEPELPGNMIIPSPVKTPIDGRLPQVDYRKYLVIRFLAFPKLDSRTQLAIIWALGELYPLVSVCSNGKEAEGYEAWFKVQGWTEEACRLFMDEACKLGADPETFDPQCFVHLPGATNPQTGKLQKLIYLDPKGKNFPDGPTPLRWQKPKS